MLSAPRGRQSAGRTGVVARKRQRQTVPACSRINSEADAGTVILPIELMRQLLGEETAVSGIELRTAEPADGKLLRRIEAAAGPGFKVLDREMQRPAIYKMMKYEKLAIYSILIFVVIIVAFNIFGSLSMLRIEKSDDMRTLGAMGATRVLRNASSCSKAG